MLTYTVETDTLTITKAHSMAFKRERIRIARRSNPSERVELDASDLPELVKALQEIEPAGTEEWLKMMAKRKARTDGDG